jgi:DNA gyrase subunit A
MSENIILTPIVGEVEQSFLDYSLSVITDRAIPSAEDGLKPVARRILWDMLDKGYTNNKKFVKCAQPVGDTMGRFHPHGDSSIYGALVWLSQPWNMRYPLVDFHGNNGSRDGDEPAAYRYTECKLSKLAEETLANIKKDTVDWVNAYTDEEQEPVYLPGLVPNLLINGTSGIAVAMACSFAPHNLNEIIDAIVYTIEHPDCECKELLQFVTGPDFPTGGLVINKDELPAAYLTGKGRARIRGEYTIETKNCRDSIVFTSIPYKVSKENLIVDIDKKCESGDLTGISTIRDESNSLGVRFVIELDKGVAVEPIIAKLFKLTSLETTYSFNQVALHDKTPRLLNLKQLIEIYIAHQQDVIVRQSQFEYNKAAARAHVLEGLLKALEDIDNIIQMIKKSESAAKAKEALIAKYKFSEPQVKAILDMKLSKLANLEQVEINEEHKSKLNEMAKLQAIISNPQSELTARCLELKKKYGDARRTTITQVAITKEEKEIEFVEPEKCVVVMTEGGTIKRIPTSSFRAQRRNGKGVKTQEDITSAVIRTNTIDKLMVFTNQGRMYRLLVNDIPESTNAGKGSSIRALIAMETGEEPTIIYSIYRDTDAQFVLFVTKNGTIKKTSLEEYVNTKKKTGIGAINLREGDSLAAVSLVKDEQIAIVTKAGYVLKIKSTDVTASSRMTIGVKGINLGKDDYVVAALPIHDETDNLALFSADGYGKKIAPTETILQNRGGKGVVCYKGNSYISAAALVNDEDQVLICGDKNNICVSAKDIPLLGRATQGNVMVKGNRIISVTKV